jgi:hypothetical protein
VWDLNVHESDITDDSLMVEAINRTQTKFKNQLLDLANQLTESHRKVSWQAHRIRMFLDGRLSFASLLINETKEGALINAIHQIDDLEG